MIHACSLLERAGGVKLHRSLHRDKVRFLALGRWKGTLAQEYIPYPFIKLSEQLDFIGVTLAATFMHTRKLNCEVIEKRVRDTINPWRGGKFMSIVERGHSVNTYAFSKAVFRCSSIPLRLETEERVQSAARVWILQDCYEKPAAAVLHRAPQEGGLGLYSMRCRALAMLLRTFCELACNTSFRSSEYLAALWRSEVLGEWCGEVPSSPYYNKEFFSTLRHYHQTSPLNVTNMSVRDWHRALTEDRITHSPATPAAGAVLLPIRAELLLPAVDWPRSWSRAQLKGLPADLADHLFQQLHRLLPTQDRLARLGGNRGTRAPGVCRRCTPDTPDSLHHSMTQCPFSAPAATALLACLNRIAPGSTHAAALNMEYEVDPDLELPVVTLLACSFLAIWTAHKDDKALTTVRLKAALQVRVHTLQHTTKYHAAAEKLKILLNYIT